MKTTKSKLYLTEEEKSNLRQTADILAAIAESMDRAVSVPYSAFDDDEINGAVDIIEDLLSNAKVG